MSNGEIVPTEEVSSRGVSLDHFAARVGRDSMQDGELVQAGRRRRWREINPSSVHRGVQPQPLPHIANAVERAPSGSAEVAIPHRRQLEALIDLLRVALELEIRCDFGDGPQPNGPGRAAFLVHFRGWQQMLEDWEERLRRARSAPAALWVALDEAAREMGLPEPPLQIGPVVDRLATLTVQRSREGRLGAPHALFVQSLRSGYGEAARTIVYVEGQNVAHLRGDNRPLAAEIERRVQRLFDVIQSSEAALEVGRASEAVRETKERLLRRLNALAASDAIAFAPGCPVCAVQAASPLEPGPPVRALRSV
jgi:hypothetical protein